MQFSSLLAAASVLVSAVSALPVQNFVKFTVESDKDELNGKGLSSIHEGAAINYVFLGDNSQTLNLNTTSGEIYQSFTSADGQTFNQYLSVLGGGFPGLQVSAASAYPTTWTFEDGYLKGNGSDSFLVAKNTHDPYRYSEKSYQIGFSTEIDAAVSDAYGNGLTDVNVVKVKVQQTATA